MIAFNNVTSYLNNLLQVEWNIYTTDFLDIAIIALFIYSLLVFFRRSRSHMVFLGLTMAMSFYVFSNVLNLYLTSIVLRYIAGVSAVILVVIFQSEIKKYFELLGLIGTRQIKAEPLVSRSPSISEIIQSCVKMAQTKTGALIVVQGKDLLDQYLENGIDLDGVISEEIIMSVFDPHSGGHDGAMVISNNRISRFGAHLPLSSNFKEIGKRGTRHSAALGLSENSDALCIVVSEEKGKISIAKEGKMKTLEEFTDLEKELEKYIKSKFSVQKQSRLSRIFKHNFLLKTGAVIAASLIWFFTAYQTEVITREFNVPVTFESISKDTVIESYSPKVVKVIVRGRGEQTFEKITDGSFELDFGEMTFQKGVNKLSVEKQSIVLPEKVNLISYEPETILLTVKKYNIVQVPVIARTKGTLEKELELKSVAITPESIPVWVLQDEPVPSEISTETIDVSNQSESVIFPIKVIIPENIRLVNGDATVNVALTIEEKQ